MLVVRELAIKNSRKIIKAENIVNKIGLKPSENNLVALKFRKDVV